MSQSNPNRTKLLLVLGVTQHNDDWMIGDFTGFMAAFREEFATMGDFFTAVDLDTYVKGKHSSIKFGRGTYERVVYDKSWVDQGKPKPYTLVPSSDLKASTLNWMARQAQICDSNDTVLVILIGHGDRNGSVLIGDHLLSPGEVSKALTSFDAGVNINVVTNACYGGVLVSHESLRESQTKRYIQAATTSEELSAAEFDSLSGTMRSPSGESQSSYFTGAFVKSLANISLKRPPIRRHSLTLEDHLENLTLQTYTRTPPGFRSTPSAFYDWSKSIPLELILNLEYAKISRNPTDSSRYARLESDTTIMQDMLSKLSLGLVNANEDDTIVDIDEGTFGSTVKNYLTTIGRAVDVYEVVTCDRNIFGKIEDGFTEPLMKAQCLVEVTFRIRAQSTAFEVLMMLQEHSFVKIDALANPADLRLHTVEVWDVMLALNTFDFFVKTKPLKGALYPFYEEPVMWLATMIVRGAIVEDLDIITNFIWFSGVLGAFDPEAYRSYWPAGRRLKVDPEALTVMETPRCFVAFILPVGMGKHVDRLSIYEHVNEAVEQTESLFQNYFRLTPDQFRPAKWISHFHVPAVFTSQGSSKV